MPVEQHHIATELQVSRATVSRSLRNDPMISPATRARVREAAMRLGYVVPGGEATPARKSRLVRPQGERSSSGLIHLGVISRGLLPQSPSGVVALRQLQGMSIAARAGHATLHTEYLPPEEFDRLHQPDAWPAILRQEFVSGVVLLSHTDTETVNFLSQRFPVVQCFWPMSRMKVDSVTDNSIRSIGQLFEHLVGLGHRRIGLADFGYKNPSEKLRLAGYQLALNEYGLPYDPADSQFFGPDAHDSANRAEEVADHIARRANDHGVRAWICTDDVLGYRVTRVLMERGIRVPHDISICGFDNFDAPLGLPKLTSMDSPFEEIGAAAVKQLLRRVIDPVGESMHCLIDSRLIVGQSTGRPLA